MAANASSASASTDGLYETQVGAEIATAVAAAVLVLVACITKLKRVVLVCFGRECFAVAHRQQQQQIDADVVLQLQDATVNSLVTAVRSSHGATIGGVRAAQMHPDVTPAPSHANSVVGASDAEAMRAAMRAHHDFTGEKIQQSTTDSSVSEDTKRRRRRRRGRRLAAGFKGSTSTPQSDTNLPGGDSTDSDSDETDDFASDDEDDGGRDKAAEKMERLTKSETTRVKRGGK